MYVYFCALDVNECTTYFPCLNNGTCVNNEGSYHCNCTLGWQGSDCEKGKKYNEIQTN